MNSSMLWFGFLPVLAYLAMDAFGNRRMALIGALLIGGLETAYTLAAFGGFDSMSVFAFAFAEATVLKVR